MMCVCVFDVTFGNSKKDSTFNFECGKLSLVNTLYEDKSKKFSVLSKQSGKTKKKNLCDVWSWHVDNVAICLVTGNSLYTVQLKIPSL